MFAACDTVCEALFNKLLGMLSERRQQPFLGNWYKNDRRFCAAAASHGGSTYTSVEQCDVWSPVRGIRSVFISDVADEIKRRHLGVPVSAACNIADMLNAGNQLRLAESVQEWTHMALVNLVREKWHFSQRSPQS